MNRVSSAGQIIPLLIGVAALVRVLYVRVWPGQLNLEKADPEEAKSAKEDLGQVTLEVEPSEDDISPMNYEDSEFRTMNVGLPRPVRRVPIR